MTIRTTIIGVLLAVTGASAAAQTVAATVAAPSPDHLAAATRLMDVMMPPAQREALVDGMVQAVMANLSNGALASGPVKSALESRPEARAVFDRFLARQLERSQRSLRANLPSMIEAMAVAYARRFDATQLAEMEAFFATPTGQAYVAQSATIMSDPAVAAWQQRVFAADMAGMPDEMRRLVEDLARVDGTRR